MKVTDDMGRQLHGKVGNMIYYTMNGKTYARRARIPGKKRKWEVEGRSGKQVAAATRFRALQRVYSAFCRHVSAEIWRAAARERGMMGANLFHSMNKGCFDGTGGLTDAALFRFAEGVLGLPAGMRVEAEGDGWFGVTWEMREEEREMGLALSTAAGTDRLRVGVMYDGRWPSALWAVEMDGTREECRGRFRLDPSMGTGAHVYLFFERATGGAWSPSACVHVVIEGGVAPGEE